MSTVAEQLRKAREAQQLTVQQVADATKIRTDHIAALEQGNFSVFSAPVYIRGSVKNYATMLKLDLPPILAALDAELKNTDNFSEPPPFTEESNKPFDRIIYLLTKLNLKWLLLALGLIGVVVIILIVNTVLKLHHRDPLANLPPAIYQTTNSGDTLPLPKK